jgi:hypothetical protein
VNERLEGKECYFIGNTKIKGEFKAGRPDGVCLKIKVKGDDEVVQYGIIKDDKFTEYGILMSIQGDDKIFIEGHISNGLFNGVGKLWNQERTRTYEGDFKDSLFSGEGVLETSEYVYKG